MIASTYLQEHCAQPDVQLLRLKRDFDGLISQAQLLATDSKDCDTLKAGITHLRQAIGTMKSMQSDSSKEKLVPVTSIAPNTNMQCQTRFHSTKKRRVSSDHLQLTKPTPTQVDECIRSLSENIPSDEVRVCGVCFREEDFIQSGSSNEPVQWINCTNCLTWLHVSCAGISVPQQSIPLNFSCKFCAQ